jgi:hypothetical protein
MAVRTGERLTSLGMVQSHFKTRRVLAAVRWVAAFLPLAVAGVSVPVSAGPAATQPVAPLRTPLKFQDAIPEKAFYLLPAIEQMPEVRQLLLADPSLQRIAAARRTALSAAVAARPAGASPVIESARWTDSEIRETKVGLRAVLAAHRQARSAVATRLRESGMYVREQSMSDDDLIGHAWEQAALGINHILDVYGDGKKPQYPKIDSISFDAATADWAAKVCESAAKAVAGKPAEQDTAWGVSLRLAVRLLDVNGRDEAGRFEPMSEGENKSALARVPQTDWDKYPYACIVVLGIGPETPDVPLSPGGRANCRLAADDFKAGKAPFILVSGGYVHPNKTRFCEAVEMRRELIDKLGIPADAVIIDPHARHTTTNIRNAARLVYRYGMPFDRPVLVTSNADQIGTVAGAGFAKRCVHELGYETCRIGNRVSPTELQIWFNLDCLEADAASPLDP